MKTSRIRHAALPAVLLPLFAALPAAAGDGSGPSVSINADRGIETCRDVRVRFGSRDAARAEETFSVPAGAGAFAVELPRNSGIRIVGSARNDFAVTACEAAPDASDLDEIRVSAKGGGSSLDFRGPSHGDWLVYLLVKAPRNAALDLQATNGSIAVKDVAGRITARTTNGPIGVENSSGEVELNAQNGPISLEGCTGTGEARAVNGPIDFRGRGGSYRISTRNGPISVELEGDSWGDGGLDASAVNGPLSLTIGDGYRSGVVVESRGNSPVSCPADACRTARKTWDEEARRIEFGDSQPVVRLSTRNGPVSVQSKK